MTNSLPEPSSGNEFVTDYPELAAWAGEQVRLTGETGEPHERPWSSAIRLGTTSGPVWLKVNGPGTRHEPALVRLLADRVPGLVPEVLAVATDRGWSLTRDAGPALREALSPPESWAAWERVVGEYAAAQLELGHARDAVLGAGVPEVSPATLPTLTRDLLADLGRLPVADGGVTTDEAERLAALLPRLDDWCAELEASPVPDSIQHDDLHSGNVCWSGTATIIDWGDASWGSPLATMLCTLASLSDGPVPRVRDAYLEPFTTHAPLAELVHLVNLAVWTGCVTRALSWRAAMLDQPPAAHEQWGFPVRSWLLELLSR